MFIILLFYIGAILDLTWASTECNHQGIHSLHLGVNTTVPVYNVTGRLDQVRTGQTGQLFPPSPGKTCSKYHLFSANQAVVTYFIHWTVQGKPERLVRQCSRSGEDQSQNCWQAPLQLRLKDTYAEQGAILCVLCPRPYVGLIDLSRLEVMAPDNLVYRTRSSAIMIEFKYRSDEITRVPGLSIDLLAMAVADKSKREPCAFKCGWSTQCLPSGTAVCDGRRDCANGADEDDCPAMITTPRAHGDTAGRESPGLQQTPVLVISVCAAFLAVLGALGCLLYCVRRRLSARRHANQCNGKEEACSLASSSRAELCRLCWPQSPSETRAANSSSLLYGAQGRPGCNNNCVLEKMGYVTPEPAVVCCDGHARSQSVRADWIQDLPYSVPRCHDDGPTPPGPLLPGPSSYPGVNPPPNYNPFTSGAPSL